MALQLQLDAHQIEDLRVVRDLSVEQFRVITEAVCRLDPLLRPKRLVNEIERVLTAPAGAAESLVRQLLSAHGLMRQTGLSLEEVCHGLRDALGRIGKWSADDLARWGAIEPVFRELVASNAVTILSKALELSYEYANLFRRGRILTDVRPLYSDTADAILGAVVSYTLRLRYDSSDGDHELSIAMDESDVRSLAEQCDRALKKARTARDLMVNRVRIPTIVTGNQDDG